MAEPTLSEITNIRVDPEVGSGTPANVIAASDVVRTLNENAKFKAVNDMNKYKMFTEQLSNVFQNGIDIANTEVRAEDKDRLVKGLAEVLDPISKDPHALFSRQGMTDTYGKLIKLKSDATKSKQANTFTQASREFINLNPSFRTDNNVNLVKQSEVAPLETWKPFQFDYTPHLDLASISKLLYGDGGKDFTTKFSRFSDDNKFVESGTKRDREGYLKKWNSYLDDPKIRNAFKAQYYDGLSDNMKKVYSNQDGTPNLEAYWNHLGEGTFIGGGETVEKQIANPFELENQRLKTKGAELKLKYGYDKNLVNLKQAGIIDAIKWRALYKNGAKKDASGKIVPENDFFDDAFDIILSDATNPENAVYQTDKNTGQTKLIGYKIDASGNTKKSYGIDKEDANGKIVRNPADIVLISPDGKNMVSVFGGGYDENLKTVDNTATTNAFSVNEAKAIMKKSLGSMKDIGAITSGKNVSAQQQNKGDKLPVDANGQTDPSLLVKGKVYEVSGKKYKWDGKNLNEL